MLLAGDQRPMPIFNHAPDLTDAALLLAGSATPRVERHTVFVIDQDPAVRDSLSLVLRFSGFDVVTFDSGSQFIQSLPVGLKGCLLVEFDLEDMTGAALIEHFSVKQCGLPAIIMSARLRLPHSRHRLPAHVPILQKPFGQDELLEVLRRALGSG
jgi:FixJ family two-component response regulator